MWQSARPRAERIELLLRAGEVHLADLCFLSQRLSEDLLESLDGGRNVVGRCRLRCRSGRTESVSYVVGHFGGLSGLLAVGRTFGIVTLEFDFDGSGSVDSTLVAARQAQGDAEVQVVAFMRALGERAVTRLCRNGKGDCAIPCRRKRYAPINENISGGDGEVFFEPFGGGQGHPDGIALHCAGRPSHRHRSSCCHRWSCCARKWLLWIMQRRFGDILIRKNVAE